MKVDFCAMADAANTSAEGKLNVLGVFDRIRVNSLPAVHKQMAVVLRLRVEYADAGDEHAVRLALENPDGKKLVDLEGSTRVGDVEPGRFSHSNQVFNLRDLRFEEEGVHRFRVWLDGELAAEQPLAVDRAD